MVWPCKKWLCVLWCWLTGGDAVWVKDDRDGSVEIKVARVRHDPFDDPPQLMVNWRKIGEYQLRDNGRVGNFCRWRFVCNDRHIQHQLSGQAISKNG
jgi:hypothetical protein